MVGRERKKKRIINKTKFINFGENISPAFSLRVLTSYCRSHQSGNATYLNVETASSMRIRKHSMYTHTHARSASLESGAEAGRRLPHLHSTTTRGVQTWPRKSHLLKAIGETLSEPRRRGRQCAVVKVRARMQATEQAKKNLTLANFGEEGKVGG